MEDGKRPLLAYLPQAEGTHFFVNVPGLTWIQGKICFASDRTGRSEEIYVADDDGTNIRQIYTARIVFTGGDPSCSPDGKWVAFESHRAQDEDTPFRTCGPLPKCSRAAKADFGSPETIVAHPTIVVYDVTIYAQQNLILPELMRK